MSLKTWILSRGLVGTIARDVLKKYMRAKAMLSDEAETEILKGAWGLYLMQNAPQILIGKDGPSKKKRLEEIMELLEEDENRHSSLMEIFIDILYIETEINPSSWQTYADSITIFTNEGSKLGLNFTVEAFKKLMSAR